ncbi:MAG: hypothetical protein JXR76_13240 [Deltaproteobacteria bacterium]|nr:hypothetical protein [Deltaproteobacteria bacterium]
MRIDTVAALLFLTMATACSTAENGDSDTDTQTTADTDSIMAWLDSASDDSATTTSPDTDTVTQRDSATTGSLDSDTATKRDTETATIQDSDTATTQDSDTATTQDSDTATIQDSDTTSLCTSGAKKCRDDKTMVLLCLDGQWTDWDDCSFSGKACTVSQGIHQCLAYTPIDTATDTDTDTYLKTDSDTHIDTDSQHGVTDCSSMANEPCEECFECMTGEDAPCRETAMECWSNEACEPFNKCRGECGEDYDWWGDSFDACVEACPGFDPWNSVIRAMNTCVQKICNKC